MTISVIYHLEDDAWWAESPDVPGWTVVGQDYAEVRALAVEGAMFALEADDLVIRHFIPTSVLPYLRQRTIGSIAHMDYGQVQLGAVRVGAGSPGGAPAEKFSVVA